jgi:hypothetical protein
VTCAAFLDRLYDEDARAALRGHGAVPRDIAAHILDCQACRAAYDAAAVDEGLLPRVLRQSPPPAWRADVLRRIPRPPRSIWTPRIAAVNEAVIWGILAMAASHILLEGSFTATHVAAFCAGGTVALLRPRFERPLVVLRRQRRWV